MATTAAFKRLIKRSKELRIETVSELEDLISDEFSDDELITGADYEIAKIQLKLN
jgi:hypothetical protein